MAGTLKRLFTHLFTADARGRFPPATMERIAAAIDIGETCHSGELCFAVETSLHWRDVLRGTQARARAEEIVAGLGWKDPWFLVSAIGREGTWPIMLEVMAFLDRQRAAELEARDGAA